MAQARTRHETLDQRQAKVVELRFFGGMENVEIASLLDISERTVMREWRLARAFLYPSLGLKPWPRESTGAPARSLTSGTDSPPTGSRTISRWALDRTMNFER